MKISLGPVSYYWSRDALLDFYRHAATWPVDVIYLGETVCSKRRALRTAEWIDLARDLARTGKTAVLSTLTLIEADSELSTVTKLCDNGELLVEANDMAAVQLMSENKLPFATGPAINIYNARTLQRLHKSGLIRWTAPIELTRNTLAAILDEAAVLGFKNSIDTEIFALGHVPLTYSARCFTARAHNLPKDSCGFVCKSYPDGLPVSTQDDQRLLILNGIQTQSGDVLNLLPEWQDMQTLGVDYLRINPQSRHMDEIVQEVSRALNEDAVPDVSAYLATSTCNGFWYGDAGYRQVKTARPDNGVRQLTTVSK
jgi:O2-independent ubiquinone biosynthesis protein UbiV